MTHHDAEKPKGLDENIHTLDFFLQQMPNQTVNFHKTKSELQYIYEQFKELAGTRKFFIGLQLLIQQKSINLLILSIP